MINLIRCITSLDAHEISVHQVRYYCSCPPWYIREQLNLYTHLAARSLQISAIAIYRRLLAILSRLEVPMGHLHACSMKVTISRRETTFNQDWPEGFLTKLKGLISQSVKEQTISALQLYSRKKIKKISVIVFINFYLRMGCQGLHHKHSSAVSLRFSVNVEIIAVTSTYRRYQVPSRI